ncbi:hypothetical protein X797_002963 [Metarhizium robertsii]|uniref:Rhodopsin domain-containing protein n=1 Tax=Metarhizium robertsii TaxID=568076 RepID=A0A0A1V5Z4_9HYPO|nr:hypothetical protein X797_002963 [Metarhizium robertsii]
MDTDMLPLDLQYPIETPPPGIAPNFVNPDSNAYQVYITAGDTLTGRLPWPTKISLLEFFFRSAPRSSATTNQKVSSRLYYGIGVSGSVFGEEAWNVLLSSFTKPQLVLFSVLQWMRIVSITGIVVISLWHLSTCIAFAVMCSPTGSSHLDFLAAFFSSKCSRTRSLVVIQGIGNVVTDVFLLVLPLPVVWTLRIPLGRKLGVSCMFLVGLSAMGLYYRALYYDAGQNNIRLVVTVWATAIAEVAAGVMICCMPPTAALLKCLKQSINSSVGKSAVLLPVSLQPRIPVSGNAPHLCDKMSIHNPITCPPALASDTRLGLIPKSTHYLCGR